MESLEDELVLAIGRGDIDETVDISSNKEIAVHVASRILAFPLYATRNHKGGCMSGTNKEA